LTFPFPKTQNTYERKITKENSLRTGSRKVLSGLLPIMETSLGYSLRWRLF